ncbi:MAG: hypothetical protein HRU19_13940 [Pseudobacteriovorax sp.]|nr:hypothetical protein [Pseudobacteriovorax sp.]
MYRFLSHGFLFSVLSLFNLACGSYETVHIKDYKVFVETDSYELRETIDSLTAQYNDDFGGEALEIVDDREEANSYIRFIDGLKSEENKLGLGQWITVTANEGQDIASGGSGNLERTVVYSMELDFDLENFESKQIKRDDKDSGEWRHLYHLFCHEVGHGLQMDHEASLDSVMYRSIPENSRDFVNYDKYFMNARNFFQ